jgi:hypothetical protein
MHKVIEHVHSNLQQAFRAKLRDNSKIKTAPQYVDLLFECFYSMERRAIVDDVESLPGTYAEIVRRKGAWPAKRFI